MRVRGLRVRLTAHRTLPDSATFVIKLFMVPSLHSINKEIDF